MPRAVLHLANGRHPFTVSWLSDLDAPAQGLQRLAYDIQSPVQRRQLASPLPPTSSMTTLSATTLSVTTSPVTPVVEECDTRLEVELAPRAQPKKVLVAAVSTLLVTVAVVLRESRHSLVVFTPRRHPRRRRACDPARGCRYVSCFCRNVRVLPEPQ